MSKREEQKLAALLKKVAGQPPQPKKRDGVRYDETLRLQKVQDEETKEFFKEMKRREF